MSGPSFLRNPAPAIQQGRRPIGVSSLGQIDPWRLSLLHDRPDNVLIWITRGQGRIVINGVRRGFGAHNAMFLPAGTLFALEPGAQCLGLVVQSPAGLTGRLPREALHLRVRDGVAQAELTTEIEAMQREFTKDRILLQDALDAHVRLLAVWLHRQVAAGTTDASGKETAGQRLVRAYAKALTRSYASDRGVADYAGELGMTATHLTRACRAACGRTAVEMLTERKLHEARCLLSQPQPPVNRVAAALGFHSAPYFTRFIRTHTGVSPSELRRGARPPARRTAPVR
ncbi:AraC family transcriptional regulator [Salipiger sp.]|uniref:helix-turn-helix transcriptional regulator n=1 Tax=Salipiger sp. TaxID=2078585 RepID=UPI003A971EA3